MTKLANKNNLMPVVLAVAAIAVVACDRSETLPQVAVAPAVEVVAGEENADMTLPAVVERRHFAIYNAYRVLFDDSPQVFQSRGASTEDGLQHAVVMGTDSATPACSVRAMLLQD